MANIIKSHKKQLQQAIWLLDNAELSQSQEEQDMWLEEYAKAMANLFTVPAKKAADEVGIIGDLVVDATGHCKPAKS